MMAKLGGDVRPPPDANTDPRRPTSSRKDSRLLKGLGPDEAVWASHGDHVEGGSGVQDRRDVDQRAAPSSKTRLDASTACSSI
jgi:GMP synthase-like glutamine amidotransferase